MDHRSDQVKALANETRMEVLRLLTEPARHFSHQTSADPERTGVCIQLLAEHFAVSQPTMSRHVDLLRRAGFLVAERRQKWTYCLRDEAALADYAEWLKATLRIEART